MGFVHLPQQWGGLQMAEPQDDEFVDVELVSSGQSPFSGPPTTPQFRCPFCGSTLQPVSRSKVSNAGWILFVVLLLFLCLPLCWIGLLIREENRYCSQCGMRLD